MDEDIPIKFKDVADNFTRAFLGERETGLKYLRRSIRDNEFHLKNANVQVPVEYNQAYSAMYKDILAVLNKHLA